MPAPVLEQFFPAVSQAAQQSGIREIIIMAKDPRSGEMQVIATAGAMDAFREFAAQKFKLSDPNVCEVEWPR